MKNIYSIIKLIETSQNPFYEHIWNKENSHKLEIYWIDNQWGIRLTPYQGEWIYVKELLDYDDFDLEHLEFHLANSLLLEYAYYTMNPHIEFELRIRQIFKTLGEDLCTQSLIDFQNFKKALLKAVSKSLKNPNLKLID